MVDAKAAWLSNQFKWSPTAWHLEIGNVLRILKGDSVRIAGFIEALFLDAGLYDELMAVSPLLSGLPYVSGCSEYKDIDPMRFLNHDDLRTAAFAVDLLRASGSAREAEKVNKCLVDSFAAVSPVKPSSSDSECAMAPEVLDAIAAKSHRMARESS